MAKAKKLPSGSWNMMVYSHTEAGKRKYVSFTAPTKAAVELKAAEFKSTKKRRTRYDLTVAEAIDGYITSKEGVLSPSTIKGYRRMEKTNYDLIKHKKIQTLTSEDMQLFISKLSLSGLSSKSVRNIYALLTASVCLYAPDSHFRVKLPPKQKKRPVSPSDDVVRLLFENAQNKNLRKAIALGCLGIREGEISALNYEDIQDNIIHISKDMIMDQHGAWILKEIPKTEDGDRFVKMPAYFREIIGEGSGQIVKLKPSSINKTFILLRDKLNLKIRFHDLRHYFASTAAVLQIPDIYTADMGGWSRAGGSSVMKSVYQNNIKSMSDYYADKMAAHMESVLKPQKDAR